MFIAVLWLVAIPQVIADQPVPDNHLDSIMARGYIWVGTSGDCKPFIYLNPDTNSFERIDIDMAYELGRAMGVEVRFFKTLRPALMKDFHEGKFDIGMGGISINLGRQKRE